jgi:hypothetical protein
MASVSAIYKNHEQRKNYGAIAYKYGSSVIFSVGYRELK